MPTANALKPTSDRRLDSDRLRTEPDRHEALRAAIERLSDPIRNTKRKLDPHPDPHDTEHFWCIAPRTRCTCCGEWKHPERFGVTRWGGRLETCSTCVAERGSR